MPKKNWNLAEADVEKVHELERHLEEANIIFANILVAADADSKKVHCQLPDDHERECKERERQLASLKADHDKLAEAETDSKELQDNFATSGGRSATCRRASSAKVVQREMAAPNVTAKTKE